MKVINQYNFFKEVKLTEEGYLKCKLVPYVAPPQNPNDQYETFLVLKVDEDGNLLIASKVAPTPPPPPKEQFLYAGSDVYNSSTTRKYSLELSEILDGWPVNHEESLRGIAFDSEGNVITVGPIANDITTRKYNKNGTLLWSVNHGGFVNAVAVDSEDNIITGGDRNNTIGGVRRTTRKYDKDGNLLWSQDDGAIIRSIAIDNLDNIIIGKNRITSSPTSLVKRAPNGVLIFTRDYLQNGSSVAIYDGDKIALIHNRTSNITTRTLDSSGTLLWSADHGATAMYTVAVDSNNNIFTSGARVSNIVFRSYTSEGVPINTADGPTTPVGISKFDNDDNYYFSYTRTTTSPSEIEKLSNNLQTLLGSITVGPSNPSASFRTLAISPPE